MRAFIVRPFGTKENINFEEVQRLLIGPALAACDVQGGTTAPFMQAGNIRADMFQQLLVADIVVADISIHNANVFYELGIRHALQPQRTFLLRAKSRKPVAERTAQDEVPFDLKTDRYLEYNPDEPDATLPALEEALRQTIASEKADSPVFQMLPNLQAQDRSRYLPVPQSFRDDVELAAKAKQIGVLGLLAMEARHFFWASEGLRLVGRAQFDLKAFARARVTWEDLYRLNPADPEVNQRLGTIYQRLGDLEASDQALDRVVKNVQVDRGNRAEALSLLGRNIKDRWRASWTGLSGEEAATKALDAPELLKSYEKYRQAFQENLDSFYPGLNALSLLTLAIELAKALPEVWESRFETEEQAKVELDSLQAQRQRLVGAVGVSLDAAKQRLVQSKTEDRWVDISLADYQFLTVDRPKKVAFAYKSALAGAAPFYYDAARSQIEIFRDLGVLTENARQALEVFLPPVTTARSITPARVVLFTGHMIDTPSTVPPRFPESLRDSAREAIRSKLQQEIQRTDGPVIGIASGANGGDLLFHEVCDELGIEHRLYLPLPPDSFRNESVTPAGMEWENRFDALLRKCPEPPCLSEDGSLPLWLSVRNGYTTWQRANLWLIQEALAVGAKNFSLLALWDGAITEGLGGTYHMRSVAEEYGAALVTIYTRDLPTAGAASSGTA